MKLATLNSSGSSCFTGGSGFIVSGYRGFGPENMLPGYLDSEVVGNFKGDHSICESGYLTMQTA
jgi:hypothetical protein